MAVLVVDDDEAIRNVVRQFLEIHGFTVIEAGDGEAALEAVDAAHIDVALVDVHMPGMSGLRLVAELRARRPRLHLIVLTADGAAGRGRALRFGANDYLTKPFALADLAARLKTLTRTAS